MESSAKLVVVKKRRIADSSPWWTKTRSPLLAFLLVFSCLVHFSGVVGLFGVKTLSRDNPVVSYDYGMHFYRASKLASSGGFPGLIWDPGYMAGYRLGGVIDIDNRLGEVGVWMLMFLPQGIAWNWTLLFLFLLVPFLMLVAARWYRLSPNETKMSVILSIAVFWSIFRSHHQYIKWGMYGWVIASAALTLMISGLHMVIEKPTVVKSLAYGVVMAFVGLAHNLTALYLPFVVLFFLLRISEIKLKQIFMILLSAIICIILILPFLIPVLKTIGEFGNASGGLSLFFQSTPGNILESLVSGRNRLQNAVILFAALGLIMKPIYSRANLELGIVSVSSSLFSLFGFLIPAIKPLQPTRLLLPAAFLAVIPASIILTKIYLKINKYKAITIIATILVTLFIFFPSIKEVTASVWGRRLLVTGPSQGARELIEYLKVKTTDKTRILIEDDGDNFGGNHFGQTHLVGYLAQVLGRELIGGPYPVTLSRVSYASFVNGRLIEKDINSYTQQEFMELAENYNIGNVVIWSETSRKYFIALGLEEMRIADQYSVFHLKRKPKFAEGCESVCARSDLNMIRVEGACSPSTILKWNYDPKLVTEPAMPLRPKASPYSRSGFIEVDNHKIASFIVRFAD